MVDGENALLVKAGDVDGLVKAVGRVAGDAGLRDRLSEGARMLSGFFSWASIAESHARLYDRLR